MKYCRKFRLLSFSKKNEIFFYEYYKLYKNTNRNKIVTFRLKNILRKQDNFWRRIIVVKNWVKDLG